ncbi:MAG: CRISPR-associated endonuclease Cas6 [Bacteroidota bacterium]
MKKLRVMTAAFDTNIEPYEIPAFRGAIASKVGLQHEWYHNHNNQNLEEIPLHLNDYEEEVQVYHNRYPLIQYKISANRHQKRPMLMCLGECVEEAHKFFSKPDWTINLNGRVQKLSISNLNVNQYTIQTWENEFYYNIYRWQALNSENWRAYQKLEGIVAQTQFLENILAGHIKAFVQGIGLDLTETIQPKILQIKNEKWISYKKVKVKCFDLSFKTNVFLPEYIGLGKGVAKGLGVVRKMVKRKT